MRSLTVMVHGPLPPTPLQGHGMGLLSSKAFPITTPCSSGMPCAQAAVGPVGLNSSSCVTNYELNHPYDKYTMLPVDLKAKLQIECRCHLSC